MVKSRNFNMSFTAKPWTFMKLKRKNAASFRTEINGPLDLSLDFDFLLDKFSSVSLVQDGSDLEIVIKECEEAIKKREVQFTEAQVALNEVKLNAERKITEQDQIIHDIRRTCNQEIDVIQAAYDDEAHARSDVGRGNKKMDQDLADLQAGLIRAGKQIVDAEKASKDLANQLKETILKNDVVERQVFDAKVSF